MGPPLLSELRAPMARVLSCEAAYLELLHSIASIPV